MPRLIVQMLVSTAFISVFLCGSVACNDAKFQGTSKPKEPAVEPTGLPATGTTPTPASGDAQIQTEDNIIEGVPVVKVGINYEDGTDNDFNDAVLCFSGKFVVDAENKRVQSAIDTQSIQVVLTSHASCTHTVRVQVLGTDGNEVSHQDYPDVKNGQNTFNFDITKGQFLNTMLIKSCKSSLSVPQNGPKCQVLANVCNTTGG